MLYWRMSNYDKCQSLYHRGNGPICLNLTVGGLLGQWLSVLVLNVRWMNLRIIARRQQIYTSEQTTSSSYIYFYLHSTQHFIYLPFSYSPYQINYYAPILLILMSLLMNNLMLIGYCLILLIFLWLGAFSLNFSIFSLRFFIRIFIRCCGVVGCLGNLWGWIWGCHLRIGLLLILDGCWSLSVFVLSRLAMLEPILLED